MHTLSGMERTCPTCGRPPTEPEDCADLWHTPVNVLEDLRRSIKVLGDRMSEIEMDMLAYRRRKSPPTPKPDHVDALYDMLSAAEGHVIPMSDLRGDPQYRINKNVLSPAIEIGCREGRLRLGTIVTGEPGRPRRILGRGDCPLPDRYDIYRIIWEKR